MAINQDYLAFILDQLSEIPELSHKRMFGGIGFFREGIMFAMIAHDKFRLRANDETASDFESYGMQNFQPYEKKSKGLPYWEVPLEILEDKSLLLKWAEKAFQVAKAAKKK